MSGSVHCNVTGEFQIREQSSNLDVDSVLQQNSDDSLAEASGTLVCSRMSLSVNRLLSLNFYLFGEKRGTIEEIWSPTAYHVGRFAILSMLFASCHE